MLLSSILLPRRLRHEFENVQLLQARNLTPLRRQSSSDGVVSQISAATKMREAAMAGVGVVDASRWKTNGDELENHEETQISSDAARRSAAHEKAVTMKGGRRGGAGGGHIVFSLESDENSSGRRPDR